MRTSYTHPWGGILFVDWNNDQRLNYSDTASIHNDFWQSFYTNLNILTTHEKRMGANCALHELAPSSQQGVERSSGMGLSPTAQRGVNHLIKGTCGV